MVKNRVKKSVLITLAVLSMVVVVLGVWMVYDHFKPHTVTIAAGNTKDESYVLMQALKDVAAKYYPDIRINLRQTLGTAENQQLLERGDVQFAAVQADISAGSHARIVASLFEEDFQLLVHEGSPVTRFPELKSKRIALPRTGGQLQTFLTVARHFGMKENDFSFVGGDNDRADQAFEKEEADARFVVRPLNNAGIAKLAAGGKSNFLPIDQALRVQVPAYVPVTIPAGAYSGNPAVPAADVPTIAVLRLLLVRDDVENSVVRALTEVLMDRRQEIAAAIPAANAAVRTLISQFAQPAMRAGLSIPVHAGAASYYDPGSASFVSAHARSIGLAIAAVILAMLWVLVLRRASLQARKVHADQYHQRVVQLMEEAQRITSASELEPVQAELMALMMSAVSDLAGNRLSKESFQSFNTVWQIAAAMAGERKAALNLVQGGAEKVTGSTEGPATPGRWSLARYLKSN